jgi:hypothetical protein
MNELIIGISLANFLTIIGTAFTIYGRLVRVETKVDDLEKDIEDLKD